MNDYEVRFVFELVNIVTYVSADEPDEAIRWAEVQVSDSGISFDKADEVVVTIVGEWSK